MSPMIMAYVMGLRWKSLMYFVTIMAASSPTKTPNNMYLACRLVIWICGEHSVSSCRGSEDSSAGLGPGQ